MKNNYLKVFALSVFMLFASCISSKVDVPYSATSREIVQMAQTEFNNGMYHRALAYYSTLLQRYGNDNAVYVEGRYEIAHIYIKQKKYSQAKPMHELFVQLGVKSEYHVYGNPSDDWAQHVFHLNLHLEAARQCNDEEAAFLLKF